VGLSFSICPDNTLYSGQFAHNADTAPASIFQTAASCATYPPPFAGGGTEPTFANQWEYVLGVPGGDATQLVPGTRTLQRNTLSSMYIIGLSIPSASIKSCTMAGTPAGGGNYTYQLDSPLWTCASNNVDMAPVYYAVGPKQWADFIASNCTGTILGNQSPCPGGFSAPSPCLSGDPFFGSSPP
jgi:hypothetical protein